MVFKNTFRFVISYLSLSLKKEVIIGAIVVLLCCLTFDLIYPQYSFDWEKDCLEIKEYYITCPEDRYGYTSGCDPDQRSCEVFASEEAAFRYYSSEDIPAEKFMFLVLCLPLLISLLLCRRKLKSSNYTKSDYYGESFVYFLLSFLNGMLLAVIVRGLLPTGKLHQIFAENFFG